MQAVEVFRALCVVILLGAASWNALAQARVSAKMEPLNVPDLVADAYRYGDFAELERLYATYGKPGVRSELTGNPRVMHFWMGIGKISNSGLRVTDQYYQQLEAQAQRWSNEHPQSVLAQLLYAQTLRVHAWVYRGGGYANTVSPAAWAGFNKYLNLAAEQLFRAKALAAKDSSWNALMLDVGKGIGWDREQLMAVFQDGIAKDPDNDTLYFWMAESLLPKWGGDLKTISRFIAKVVKDTKDQRGLEMYARLYAGLSYGEMKQTLFTSTDASWPSMKIGFEDWLKRYPHTDHRNIYAYFACMADDMAVLQEQLALIGDKFTATFWGDTPERTFESCKAMAQRL